tara:strand:- start:1380 stop:1742 length:363 start_codon:yes stop_codon:yes gene_type:complete
MSFSEAIQSGFKNYANFNGRASRSEHNYWILFAFFISIATTILDITFFGIIEISPINTLASLILWLPGLAVAIRRLHDINKSGWNVLWALTCIGIFPLIYWNYLQVGDEGENLYGPDPFG